MEEEGEIEMWKVVVGGRKKVERSLILTENRYLHALEARNKTLEGIVGEYLI